MTDSTAPENETPSDPPDTNEPEPAGIFALAGLWEGIMTDEEVDEFIRHIYAEREKDKGRPVDLSHLLDD